MQKNKKNEEETYGGYPVNMLWIKTEKKELNNSYEWQLYVFNQTLPWTGCNTKFIFKQSTAG